MIKRLCFYDFDGTVSDSMMPEQGKHIWKQKTGQDWQYKGWWSKIESLDKNVFENKLFPNIIKLIKSDCNNSETYVVILTNRMLHFENRIKEILIENGINVDEINTKRDYHNKGQRLLSYIEKFPDLKQINCYEDDDEKNY